MIFRFSIIILVLSTTSVFGQTSLGNLHYISKIENSKTLMEDKVYVHSGIYPQVRFSKDSIVWDKWFKKEESAFRGDNRHLRIYPITDLSAGFSSQQNVTYSAGLGVGVDVSYSKFFLTTKLQPFLSAPNFLGAQIQNSLGSAPGGMRSFNGSLFFQGEMIAAYKANKFFTLLGGYGKNFFGEGYRSMLLSDNATAQPFAKMETTFGPIKYVNLFQMWTDNPLAPLDRSQDQYKFSATHYLSWNITREINLSVFETVVWQSQDSAVNRTFDFNYLNPFVFYRSVEYGIGSADNVLLGINLTGKINKNHQVYTQFLLDEFLLSEIQAQEGWWGNKFGFQLGYKSNSFLLEDLYFQTEFNVVRPFTYSHKFSTQNYGHLNASVTHPLGANFYELLNIMSYRKGDFRITNKLVVNSFGVDTGLVNNGQNIFSSYSDRESDYGHTIGQGLRKTVFNETITLHYPIFEAIDLFAFAQYNWRMEWQSSATIHEHFISVGLRSRLWNSYTDF